MSTALKKLPAETQAGQAARTQEGETRGSAPVPRREEGGLASVRRCPDAITRDAGEDGTHALDGSLPVEDWFIAEWIRAMIDGHDEWLIDGEVVRLEDVRFE